MILLMYHVSKYSNNTPCTSLLQDVKRKMLPTPAKFHYTFNLRDLSRVWQGMLTVTSEVLQEVSLLLHLWNHEITRVLHDRFGLKIFKYGNIQFSFLERRVDSAYEPTFS